MTYIDGLEDLPVPDSSGLARPVPPLQVTDWLQSRRQEAVSKMDKFLADASHRRTCIFMTCSKPVTLTFSVMQYFLPPPRDVALPDQPVELAHGGVARHFQGARDLAGGARLPATWAMNTGSAT